MDLIHDQTNEQVVIGGLLKATKEDRALVLDTLNLDMFAVQANRDIISALRVMSRKGATYAADTVVQASNGTVELQYVLEIQKNYDELPVENFIVHTDQLRRATAKRNAIDEWDRLLMSFSDQDSPLEDVEDAANELIRKLRDGGSGEAVVTGEEAAEEFIEELDENRKEPKFVPTGYKELDEFLVEGFRPGRLITIAGRPSIGKSTFVSNLLVSQLARGREWLVVPIEPGIQVILQQMACIINKVDIDAFIKHPEKMTDDVFEEVANTYRRVVKQFKFIKGRPTLERLEAEIRAARPHGVVIDLFEYALPDVKADTIQQSLRSLRNTAQEADTCAVVVQQIKRPDKKMTEKAINKPYTLRPTIDVLKQSGGYEEVSDTIFLLHRDKAYNAAWEADELEVHIAKQKTGLKNYRFIYEFEGPQCRVGQYVRTIEGEHDVCAEADQEA